MNDFRYDRKVTLGDVIPFDVLVSLDGTFNKKCMFCNTKYIDEKLYGKLFQFNNIVVHHFCVLLSPCAQNGPDPDGIYGFLPEDIMLELKRGYKKVCFYCNKKGATIACSRLKCKKIFHLPCGIKHKSMHQFFLSYKSFCQQHRIQQVVNKKYLKNTSSMICPICYEGISDSPKKTSIWAPCCNNTWFHRSCIQELAFNSGFNFKCPLCNNKGKFKTTMLNLGIFIPTRHPTWEAEVFIAERRLSCTAEDCLCPFEDNREHNQDVGIWKIIICYVCGSNGIHVWCGKILLAQRESWACMHCSDILAQRALSRNGGTTASATSTSNTSVSQGTRERTIETRTRVSATQTSSTLVSQERPRTIETRARASATQTSNNIH